MANTAGFKSPFSIINRKSKQMGDWFGRMSNNSIVKRILGSGKAGKAAANNTVINNLNPTRSTLHDTIGTSKKPNIVQKANGINKRAISRVRPKGIRAGGLIKGAVGVTALAVGAAAMVSIGMLNGGIAQGRDIVYQRYMQDQRFSSNMLNNARLGSAVGSNRLRRYGNTDGLTLAMYGTRHG